MSVSKPKQKKVRFHSDFVGGTKELLALDAAAEDETKIATLERQREIYETKKTPDDLENDIANLKLDPMVLLLQPLGTIFTISTSAFANLETKEIANDVIFGRERRWKKYYLRFRPNLDTLFNTIFILLKCRVFVLLEKPLCFDEKLIKAVFGKWSSHITYFKRSQHKSFNLAYFWKITLCKPERTLFINHKTFKIFKILEHDANHTILLDEWVNNVHGTKKLNDLSTLEKRLKKLNKAPNIARAQEARCVIM
jgi:hypothetical protein